MCFIFIIYNKYCIFFFLVRYNFSFKMPLKKSDKDDSAKSSKKKTVPSCLAKEDITAILFAKQLKAGIKKVNAHYHIGSTMIKKIWTSSNPYEHANSIGEPNLPEWYNKNVKFKESSP